MLVAAVLIVLGIVLVAISPSTSLLSLMGMILFSFGLLGLLFSHGEVDR